MIDMDFAGGEAALSIEIDFPAGLPGFPGAHDFQLSPLGDARSPFLLLSAFDDPGARFIVVSPWAFYPDYELVLDERERERFGVRDTHELLVLCMVTVCDEPRHATVNLSGPIVVNRRTLEAAQVFVHAFGYGMRTPLAVAS
jgi:flagellar assembly factor FliW